MKQLFKTFVLLLLVCMIPAGTANATKAPKISRKSVNICIGDSAKLQVKNTKKSVTWKSNNKKVVSVTKKGKLKQRSLAALKL